MTAPYKRTSPVSVTQDHQRRIRNIEATGNGNWVYVGDTWAPEFLNGWANSGGGLVPMRFRALLGGGFEVQGSVTGGASGDPVFILPERFWPPAEIRCAASDELGNFIVFRVTASGECIFGL